MILYFAGLILLRLLVIVAIALGIYKLVVFIHRRYEKHGRWNSSSAIEVLKKRFALGEIEEDEYRTRLRVLRS
jgi:uncharacterized membrane protein